MDKRDCNKDDLPDLPDLSDHLDLPDQSDLPDRPDPTAFYDLPDLSDPADYVAEAQAPYRRLRPSGGYRSLRGFQVTTLIYDATVRFCEKWVSRFSRTTDQMVQAARSGRQNIAEGSRASATSASSELHLSNVARASLEELLLDYEDYLRQQGLPQWEKDDEEAREIRGLAREMDRINTKLSDQSHRKQDDARKALYAPWLGVDDPVRVANAVICLIHQANFLLDKRAVEMERSVIEQGGYREQLTQARMAQRGQPQPNKCPSCPDCSAVMRWRSAKAGRNAGSSFWGCSKYPECRGTREVEDPADQTNLPVQPVQPKQADS